MSIVRNRLFGFRGVRLRPQTLLERGVNHFLRHRPDVVTHVRINARNLRNRFGNLVSQKPLIMLPFQKSVVLCVYFKSRKKEERFASRRRN